MRSSLRFFTYLAALLPLAAVLAACVVTPLPPTDTPTPGVESVDAFADRLTVALVNRNYDQLQTMKSDPFLFGFWQSEGFTATPAQAIEQWRVNYLGPARAIAFDTAADLTALLGMDPLTMWGPDVNTARALYVKGLAPEGLTEAILIIAQDDVGVPFWYSALISNGGFAPLPPPPTPTFTPTPAPIIPNTPTFTPLPVPVPERINFAPGATGVSLTGDVAFPMRKQYVLRALRGQIMRVEITSSDGQANFAIQGLGDGQPYKRLENEARSFALTLPSSQDYLITIARPDGASSYVLRIQIDPLPAPGVTPERIQFGPGEIRTERSGMLAAGGGFKQYVLNAAAGQVMDVRASGSPAPVSFNINSPGGSQWFNDVFGYDAAIAVKTIGLPEDGDYLITVTTPNAAPASSYEIVFEVVTPAAAGAAPERVSFPSGATGTNRHGGLLAGGSKRYILGAVAGQTMRVSTTARGVPVRFTMQSPGGTLYEAEQFGSEVFIFGREIVLPENGDYLVTLSTPASAQATLYDVSFEITGATTPPTPTPAPDAPPERINFAPGTTSASLTGSITWPNRKHYVLRALAGQVMHIDIASPDGQANFATQGLSDGQPYKRLENEARSHTFSLPATQDYLISIARPSGSSDYSLFVEVTDLVVEPPAPERVNFAPGATSATRTGVIRAGVNIKQYVLGAAAGQTMRVAVTSDSIPIDIIVAKVGVPTPIGSSGAVTLANSLEVVLPASGDYFVELNTAAAAIDTAYTVLFEIR